MSTQLEIVSPSLHLPDTKDQPTPTKQSLTTSRRLSTLVAGFTFGAATQLVFLWTVVELFQFLRYGSYSSHAFSPLRDTGLALFFALPHSLLLLPAVNKSMRRSIPSELLGCVHCLATCISLLVLFRLWTPSSNTIWNFSGLAEQVMLLGFYGSWVALFYSLYLTGLGYQTGVLPWWCWLQRKKVPLRKFEPQSLFRFMRHPVYLSFLGLIWFTPRMTIDHAVLTIVWTAYIYVGSYLKDKRLERFIGDPYREYSSRVTGFPLIGFGPWGIKKQAIHS